MDFSYHFIHTKISEKKCEVVAESQRNIELEYTADFKNGDVEDVMSLDSLGLDIYYGPEDLEDPQKVSS